MNKLAVAVAVACSFGATFIAAGQMKQYTIGDVLKDKRVHACLKERGVRDDVEAMGVAELRKLNRMEKINVSVCVVKSIEGLGTGRGRIRNPDKALAYANAMCEAFGGDINMTTDGMSFKGCDISLGYATGERRPYVGKNTPPPSYDWIYKIAQITSMEMPPAHRDRLLSDVKKRVESYHRCMEGNDKDACRYVYAGKDPDSQEIHHYRFRSPILDKAAVEHACNDLKDGDACFFIYKYYYGPRGAFNHPQKVKSLLKKGCDYSRNKLACYNYGVMLAQERQFDKRGVELGAPYFKIACDNGKGYPGACYNLALYEINVRHDVDAGKQMMAELCEDKGHEKACNYYNEHFGQ